MQIREQHPKVHQRRNGEEAYWYFRYWKDELLPNGLVTTTRQLHRIGPSKGPTALTRLNAEEERDKYLSIVNASPVPTKVLLMPNEPAEAGAILFGKLAEMWEWDYVERVVGGKALVAASTKQKYRNHLHNHILPRWAGTPIGQFRAKEVLDWLSNQLSHK